MITENVSTLKIHKLSEEQYRRELEAGNIDETALYLTPNDDQFGHNHDEDYDAKGSADAALNEAKEYVDDKLSGLDLTGNYDTKGSAEAALEEAKTYADDAATKVKNDLLNGAGTAYDTLKELGDLIDDNQDAISALEKVAASKAAASDLTSHTGDTTKHITADERTNWNAAKTHADSTHARTDATKVEDSSTNGNIKINGSEVNVYTLPAATSSALGGVKSGTDITVDANGNVSVNDDSHNHVISNIDGLQAALNGKLSASAFSYDSSTGTLTLTL